MTASLFSPVLSLCFFFQCFLQRFVFRVSMAASSWLCKGPPRQILLPAWLSSQLCNWLLRTLSCPGKNGFIGPKSETPRLENWSIRIRRLFQVTESIEMPGFHAAIRMRSITIFNPQSPCGTVVIMYLTAKVPLTFIVLSWPL